MTATDAVQSIVNDPWGRLVRDWNWKSALFSSVIRGCIFFGANASAGPEAAAGASLAEFAFGATVGGLYGSLVQMFRKVEPTWQAALSVGLILPGTVHTLEFLLHWWRGTPNLDLSVAVSICYTGIAMLFNLYAMRRGVMVVGEQQRPLLEDVRMFPSIIAGFLLTGVLFARRLIAEAWAVIPFSDRGV